MTPTPSVTQMRAEIEEQPQALRATLDALLPRTGEVAALGRRTRQVLFIARGTSDNAAVYGSYLVQVRAGRLATLASPSVATAYRSRLDLSGVLAVALSQSGRTEEIVETLAWAADCGARTLAITNGAGSPLAEAADVALVTEAGVERAVPATKTFTTALAALAVLGIGLAPDTEGAGTAGRGRAALPYRTRSSACWPLWVPQPSWTGSSAGSPGSRAWWSPAAASPTPQRWSSR